MYKTLHPYPTIIESINCLSLQDLKQTLFNANNLIKIIEVKRERVFLQCGTLAHYSAEYVLKWEDYYYGLLFYRDWAKWTLDGWAGHGEYLQSFPHMLHVPQLKPHILFPEWTTYKHLHKTTRQALLEKDPEYYRTFFK